MSYDTNEALNERIKELSKIAKDRQSSPFYRSAIQEFIDSAPNIEKRIVDGKREFIVIPKPKKK